MCLEPLNRPAVAMAFPDVCHGVEEEPRNNAWWIFAAVFLFTCVFTVGFLAWKRLNKRILEAEIAVGGLQVNLISAEQQLADHCEFAAGLDERLNNAEELHEALATRTAIFEEQAMENFSSNEEFMDCLRYGIMEIGGFIRNQTLNREQRSHMLIQERANLVLWNLRNQSDTTDVAAEDNAQKHGEEEAATSDPEVSPDATILLDNLRRDQNNALAGERWNESSQLQQAIVTLLEATSGPNAEGLSMRVLALVRNICQRLYRYHRNRGLDERAEKIRLYVTDMQSLMR
jgi:hypothetical protein